jgi:hypothetical protein
MPEAVSIQVRFIILLKTSIAHANPKFTVGKIDAGQAILISPENHIIEFPSSILPDNVHVGSIINLTLERNKEEEAREYEGFMALQDEIYQEFSLAPASPAISVKRVTAFPKPR